MQVRTELLPVTRRQVLGASLAMLAGGVALSHLFADAGPGVGTGHAATPASSARSTTFQIGCFTFPYMRFPLLRALEGISRAGFRYVGWGATYQDLAGQKLPVVPQEAEPSVAKELGQRCRDLGLEPVLMFSMVFPEQPDAVKALTQRIKQASAAGVAQLVTYGHTRGANRSLWTQRLKQLGPIAADHQVTLVIKPHGVENGSGRACAEIAAEVDHTHVMVNYDAGKVQQQLNIDPIRDLRSCANYVRSFSIRDHRYAPKDEDCGVGLGEIDHYKLLEQVAHTGKTVPLVCENLLAPLLPLPQKAEEVDDLALRARLFLELVVAGLQQTNPVPITASRP